MQMSMYEELVIQTQMNYSRYYEQYQRGKTAVRLSEKEPPSYKEQIPQFADRGVDGLLGKEGPAAKFPLGTALSLLQDIVKDDEGAVGKSCGKGQFVADIIVFSVEPVKLSQGIA